MILGIFGAGGLGREVHIIARKINAATHKWEDIVYIDENAKIKEVLGVKSYTLSEIQKIQPDLEAVIAVGEPATREKLYHKLKEKDIPLATLVHPGVYLDESTKAGEGSVICEGVTITSCVTLEENVYVQPHAVIGHDISIGGHSVIGANAQIGGANKIGQRVFVGFLAGTLQGLAIGDDVEISAGSMVFRDIEPGMIVMGNPARVIRRNEGWGVFGKGSHKNDEK